MESKVLFSGAKVIVLSNITAASSIAIDRHEKVNSIIAIGDTQAATLDFGTAASGSQLGTVTATAANTEYPSDGTFPYSVDGGFTLHLTPSAGTWTAYVDISSYKE